MIDARHRHQLVFLALVIALLGTSAPEVSAQDDTPFRVGAASSLGAPLSDALEHWRSSRGVPGELILGSSSAIARNVEQGAPLDLILCAGDEWIEHLEAAGRLRDGSRAIVGANTLVVAVRVEGGELAPLHPRSPALRQRLLGRRWASGDPMHVPLGIAAQRALANLGLWMDVAGELVSAPDAAAALRLIERGEVEWGLVYKSDALHSPELGILAELPIDSAPPLLYHAALRRDAHPAAAEFLSWLLGEHGQMLFLRHSLLPATLAREHAARSVETPSASSDATRGALLLSLRVSLWATLVVALPGIALGWLLARKRFPGRLVLDALVHLPLVLTPVVVGYLLLMLVGQQGLLGPTLESLGLQIAFSFPGAVLASAVIALPLVVRSVRTAVELVDPALEDAAAVLGAGPWRRFFSVTLPLAAPGVIAGLTLGFARSLGEFGATMTLASSFPGSTRTLPLAIYGAIQQPGGEQAALRLTAFSVILSFLALAASELFLRHLRRQHGASA